MVAISEKVAKKRKRDEATTTTIGVDSSSNQPNIHSSNYSSTNQQQPYTALQFPVSQFLTCSDDVDDATDQSSSKRKKRGGKENCHTITVHIINSIILTVY